MARTGRPRGFDRDNALRAALTLFWKQGYEPTSLNQLKEAMGDISPTSFYAAFGSKEALFYDALALYRANEGRVTDILRDDSLSPRAAIETCLRQSAKMQTDTAHPLGCLVAQGASNCSPENDPVAEVLRKERNANRTAITAQIKRAVTRGELPADTDVEGLATFFNTFLLGIATAARDGANAAVLDGAVDAAMRSWPSYIHASPA